MINSTNLLIQKVEVEKINGDRKNIRLKIFYDFNAPDIDIEMNLNNKSYEKNIQEIGNKNMACSRYSLVKKCSCVDTKQSWLCKTWFIARKRKTFSKGEQGGKKSDTVQSSGYFRIRNSRSNRGFEKWMDYYGTKGKRT